MVTEIETEKQLKYHCTRPQTPLSAYWNISV